MKGEEMKLISLITLVVLVGCHAQGKELTEREKYLESIKMTDNCTKVGENMERCENKEVVCYKLRHSFDKVEWGYKSGAGFGYGYGGLSCKWKNNENK